MANAYEYEYDKYGLDASTTFEYTNMLDNTIPNKPLMYEIELPWRLNITFTQFQKLVNETLLTYLLHGAESFLRS